MASKGGTERNTSGTNDTLHATVVPLTHHAGTTVGLDIQTQQKSACPINNCIKYKAPMLLPQLMHCFCDIVN